MSAVVLLSGGLDSAVVLAICKAEGKSCHALSFRYGQRHAVELRAATMISQAIGVQSHHIIELDHAALAGSALTGASPVPMGRSTAEMGRDIPATYVPARNTLFVAYAMAFAETVGATEIALGINALDYSGYPDCRPQWVEAMQEVIRVGTRAGAEGAGIRLLAPLVHMTKAEIIRHGLALGVNFAMTHSCYNPSGANSCGSCDSCLIRAAAFAEVGILDPGALKSG